LSGIYTQVKTFRRQGSATGIRREYENFQDFGRYLCIYRASLFGSVLPGLIRQEYEIFQDFRRYLCIGFGLDLVHLVHWTHALDPVRW